MKINKYILIVTILLFGALIVKIIVNDYEIREYKSQIEDLRQNIRYDVLADSILGVEKDSLGRSYYIVYKDDLGKKMTYKEMIKTIDNQERVIKVQDVVIENAKKYFKFNYAVKDSSGYIITKFWRKDGKNIE